MTTTDYVTMLPARGVDAGRNIVRGLAREVCGIGSTVASAAKWTRGDSLAAVMARRVVLAAIDARIGRMDAALLRVDADSIPREWPKVARIRRAAAYGRVAARLSRVVAVLAAARSKFI